MGNKSSRKATVIILVAALIMLGAFLVWYMGIQPSAKENPVGEQNAALGILPGMTEEEIEERLNQAIRDSEFNVSINPAPYFENGAAEGNLRIENVPNNKYGFTVEVTREDTGETVYRSGLIFPGYYVENAKLDVPLAQGQYVCVAHFTAYDRETREKAGSAGVQIVITVGN